MKIISLGCGAKQEKGVQGYDRVDFKHNRIWEACRDKIPEGDSTIDEVRMWNFIEHINREYWPHVFNECHRVLKPAGILIFNAPNAAKNLDIALADPTHLSMMVKGTIKYITGQRPRNADYGFKKWSIIQVFDDAKDERVFVVHLKPIKP